MTAIEGVLLVDKAKGSSSFKVVSQVRRALGTRAVGHVGTLDPLASGLLVFVIGRYTRLSNYLMAGDKEYRATIALGSSTTTDDKEGELLEEASAAHIGLAEVEACLPNFLGAQQQTPPAYSAISINGVRAYKRARAGENVEMPSREIEIHALSLVHFSNSELVVDVRCSKGTYIRSLARDIGKALGVPAHLADLRRTRCSGYDLNDALSEADLADHEKARAHLQTGLPALKGLQVHAINCHEAQRLRSGLRVDVRGALLPEGVFLTALDGEPVALCRVEREQLVSVRGF